MRHSVDRRWSCALLALAAWALGAGTLAADEHPRAAPTWPADVHAALASARAGGKLVLVYVSEPPST